MSDYLSFTKSLAVETGKLIVEMRKSNCVSIDYKGARNLVTSADRAADAFIIEKIHETFPGHSILSEETSPEYGNNHDFSSPLWVIDPIDGTTNYAHGHYSLGVSIALCIEGKMAIGVVYAPFLDELFYAARGMGAFLNGQKISVSATSDLESALIATGFPYERDELPSILARLYNVLSHCRDVRRNGSAAVDLCWLAAGRVDGYYESLAPWDMAAGGLIAQEAGALIGQWAPSLKFKDLPECLHSENLIAANPALFSKLRHCIGL